jgi:hypothetical protein
MTFTHVLAALIGLTVLAVIFWESSIYIDERNKLRKFTGEYYDINIAKALDEMGITKEQALKQIAEQEREYI